MGNCLSSSTKSTSEIAPFDCVKPTISGSAYAAATAGVPARVSAPQRLGAPVVATASDRATGTATVRLSGPPNSLVTSYVRFALLHKRVPLRFVPSEDQKPTIQLGSDTVSGSKEILVGFIEKKFPEPRLMMGKFNLEGFDDSTPLIARVTWLQHKSMVWHVERMARWAEDLAARGGRKAADPSAGTPRMEMRKFGKNYSQLQELMLEHAQMEERIIFPVLEAVDRGVCKSANEEHGRELPIMNGIKEDIKSIGVLDSGTSVCSEALFSLVSRLNALQERCKGHFVEEEKDLLPLVEAAELSKEQQKKLLNESFEVMRGTHSHLLDFLLEGMLPIEAMQYLDLIMKFGDANLISSMLSRNIG
ncbi:PREDICTED: uncharacterized protein LOC104811342 [Tarenaya hassleriana]|uniref:uncharacterized protein LOC104811342 n=1 Tax=Tarenaya hassleriana TaxID=28532 RepID=UPI00053C0AF3|nr:PREDICTED: uncharacterized protein LOC104811342 [Tarenaya hassleriana]